jgi:hypothetical protein
LEDFNPENAAWQLWVKRHNTVSYHSWNLRAGYRGYRPPQAVRLAYLPVIWADSCLFSLLVPPSFVFYSHGWMEALQAGDRAPEFVLPAANREGCISLADLLAGGVAVIEFLRGTW